MKTIDAFIFSTRTDVRILRHSLFWLVDCLVVVLVLSADTNTIRPQLFLERLAIVPLTASITYFIIYFLIPSYSKDHDWFKLAAGILLAVFGLLYGIRYFRVAVVDPQFTNLAQVSDPWNFLKVLRDSFRWMPGIFAAIAIKMMKSRAELLRNNEALLRERNFSELSFLKAQMHPHFLFNTLNTLYSDGVVGGGKGNEIVLRLSNLLRFILEECNLPVVSIDKEIKVVEDYIQLEKLRHGNRLEIDYQVHVQGKPPNVSPLLLMPFVENSCKHSLSSMRGQVRIKIHIDAAPDVVKLYIENDVGDKRSNLSIGTGITNVKKQLELLFKGAYSLIIREEADKYIVRLEMPTLKSHE
jgi:two-component system LytT family sensor kinase